MTLAYFDCFSGAAGDMIVGALLDAGASIDQVRRNLSLLDVSGYSVEAAKITKQGFAATQFTVHVEPGDQPHRRLRDVLDILKAPALPDRIARQARSIFEKLAAAEAQAHGTDADSVHFHEVGAVDAIVDVVAAVTALDQLEVDRVVCSPICVGSGTVRTAHGELPVPAPGTAVLLKGVPVTGGEEPGELITPTGAAILTAVADTFGPLPSMTPHAVGYGAGQRESAHRPNVLRVMLGTVADDAETDEVVILEASGDDTTGEAVGYCMERLLNAGALDAYCLPIYMKKSRPGSLLTVISTFADADRLADIIFAETTTFGVRRSTARRSKLCREHETVETPFGAVRMKVGRRGGRVITASPEYEDCRRIAKEKNLTLRAVANAAVVAWERARS